MTKRTPSDEALITAADMEFRFRGGRICLNLVETFGEWTNRRYERITSPQRWAEWIDIAGLPAVSSVPADDDLTNMRHLRKSLYALARARIGDQPLSATEVETVNSFASHPPIIRHLMTTGHWLSVDVTSSHILAEIARDAVDLFSGAYAHSIKECNDTVCPTMFVDVSRGQNRRWCSPTCGARNAEAEYRRRRRES